jgi:hypothetical protein
MYLLLLYFLYIYNNGLFVCYYVSYSLVIQTFCSFSFSLEFSICYNKTISSHKIALKMNNYCLRTVFLVIGALQSSDSVLCLNVDYDAYGFVNMYTCIYHINSIVYKSCSSIQKHQKIFHDNSVFFVSY